MDCHPVQIYILGKSDIRPPTGLGRERYALNIKKVVGDAATLALFR